jgi:hypothetical protein
VVFSWYGGGFSSRIWLLSSYRGGRSLSRRRMNRCMDVRLLSCSRSNDDKLPLDPLWLLHHATVKLVTALLKQHSVVANYGITKKSHQIPGARSSLILLVLLISSTHFEYLSLCCYIICNYHKFYRSCSKVLFFQCHFRIFSWLRGFRSKSVTCGFWSPRLYKPLWLCA